MKSFLLALLFLPVFSIAQLHTISESVPFEEPESGHGRILLLTNGNTAYLNIDRKDGINVRLYDATHKLVHNKNVEPSYGKLKAAKVEGIYETAGNITIFISEYEGRTPTLYKVVIDASTGSLKESKEVAVLNRVGLGAGYAMAFGGVPAPGFLVRKDPASGYHGAVRYNTFESNRAERVELIKYSPEGIEMSRAFLSSPDAKYKYTQILDFTLVGATTYALIYSYNSGGTDEEGGNELLLATVNNGGEVSYQNIGRSIRRKINDGLLRYNPVTGKLLFITNEYVKSSQKFFSNVAKNQFSLQFRILDPLNASNSQPVEFSSNTVDELWHRTFPKADGYAGMPQQLYINDDGTFTVLFEGIVQLYITQNGATRPAGAILGPASVITYDEQGKELAAFLIPKAQRTFEDPYYNFIPPYYIAARDNGAVALASGNQFKSLVYLHGKGKAYIMVNDREDQLDKIEDKGRIAPVVAVSGTDAMIYEITPTSTLKVSASIPPRRMAFGNPDSKKEHNLALFNISDYNREKGVYATLKLEKGKGKQVKVIWMGE